MAKPTRKTGKRNASDRAASRGSRRDPAASGAPRGVVADAAPWQRKLSPSMQALWCDWSERGEEALDERRASFGVLSASEPHKPARSVVFVYCDPAAKLGALEGEGVRLNRAKGALRTGVVPFEALRSLCETDGVLRVRPARRMASKMNLALPAVGVPAFRSASKLGGGGVVIGVVDSGIDASHPAFAGRILRIWDQTIAGPGVTEGGYGIELEPPMLTASRDVEGHGTHVAGIAAAADATFPGVAPEADLVIVKTTMLDANIADGVRYVFRVAKDLGRPAVVNLSLGGHFDAHDGTDPLSAEIDDLVGPGRIVCCAAGNEGDDAIHARLDVPAHGTVRTRFVIGDDAIVRLNCWYAGAARLELAIASPSGVVTPFQGAITKPGTVVTADTPEGRIRFTGGLPDPDNGDRQMLAEVRRSPASTGSGGTWTLMVRNPGAAPVRFDAWMLAADPASGFGAPGASDDLKIGSPGAAAGAITVAAFTTRAGWTDIDGTGRALNFVLNDVSSFSSEGPLRNGARKPDVAAPGAAIASCVSRGAPTKRSFLLDDRHRINLGTSMATPFVVGLVALLLERNPKLDPAAVKAALAAASAVPGAPAGAFDTKWGFGIVNAATL